ncbi:MAG: tetratricopeptide repeat protein [Nitrospiria bacterium]
MIASESHPGFKENAGQMMRVFSAAFLLMAQLLYTAGTAQAAMIEEAEGLARSGKHVEAEAIYDALLQGDSGHLKARLGRAHVRSWRGNHEAAQADFLAVLKEDARNTDALVGLAYSYAWSGRHQDAEQRFRDALDIDPSRVDAKKGAAFNMLWGNNTPEAIKRFQAVTQEHPKDIEAVVGLGQAFLAGDYAEEARKTFQEALQLSPENSAAHQGLEAVRHLPPNLDLSLWAGHTSNGGGTGLRTIELSALVKQNFRVWVRYDNALSLDNPALVREGRKIPSYFAGGLVNWGKIHTTRFEVGTRELRDNTDQALYQGEHVVYLSRGYALKVGGFLGPKEHGGGTDGNIYSGVNVPVTTAFSLYPTLYYTKTGGIDETEWRIVLPVEYRFQNGWRASAFPLLGDLDSSVPQASGTVWGLSALVSAPVLEKHEGHLLIRHEAPSNAEAFTTVALGVTFKLWRDK